jgi:hypothetical protein
MEAALNAFSNRSLRASVSVAAGETPLSTQIAVPGDLQSSGQPFGQHLPWAMDSRLETRGLAALQKLLALCLQAPEVDLIDMSSDPGTGSTVLQVHVRNPASRFRLGPFEAIDGIPVQVIVTEADLFA